MKVKFTARNFIYLAILIVIFYYGLKFMGNLTEGFDPNQCSVISDKSKCSDYCKKIPYNKMGNYKYGNCCSTGKCKCDMYPIQKC
jgi:hypothetical protein